MPLYTIGDTHLSLGTDKPMDVFGGAWEGYTDKLRENLSRLTDEDTLVIVGDFSWGMGLPASLPDFQFLASFPGRKLLVKGNHDLWWSSVGKMRKTLADAHIENIDFLHNNAFTYGDVALCGTRGWFFEEETGAAHDEKIMNREVGRLESSLKAAKAAGLPRIYCFMHYPPIFGRFTCPRIMELLSDYGVERCFYGHLHSPGNRGAFEGVKGGVRYTLVSADYIGFNQLKIEN
jgi:predicted phosphohydrolase